MGIIQPFAWPKMDNIIHPNVKEILINDNKVNNPPSTSGSPWLPACQRFTVLANGALLSWLVADARVLQQQSTLRCHCV
jgi:hypothetical protein